MQYPHTRSTNTLNNQLRIYSIHGVAHFMPHDGAWRRAICRMPNKGPC
jgi:hypothetical protein